MRRLIKAEWTMLMGEIKQYYLNYIFYNAGMVILFLVYFIIIIMKRVIPRY